MPTHAAPDLRRAATRGWPILLMVALPVVAHLPELGGWVSCNPLYDAPGLLAAAPRSILPGHCTIDGNVGGTLQALGGGAANAWLAGTVPWWTPNAGLGLPLAAEAQPAAFFLPFNLLLHLPAGIALLKLAVQILSGLFTLKALRELGLGRCAAAIGGGAFALNGSFAWFSHSMILPVAFLPALVFGLERSRRLASRGLPGGTFWIALGLAYSLVAGFPETAFMDGLLAGLWAVTAMFRVPSGRRRSLAVKIAVGGCAGLALSAPQWLSFLDLLPNASVGVHGFVNLNRLTAVQAAALLFPGIYGPPYTGGYLAEWTDDGGYFGPALACLAMIALCGGNRLRGLRWALGGWVAFWLCAFFGEPLCRGVWAATPILNQVQMTRYAMPSMEFAAAVLAALAVDDWRRGALKLRQVQSGAACAAILAGTVLWLGARAGRLTMHDAIAFRFAMASLLEAVLVLGPILWWLRQPPGRVGAAMVGTLLLLGAVLPFALPELAGRRPERQALGAVDFLRRHASLTRVFSVYNQVPVNDGVWFGFPSIQADLVPAPLNWTGAAKRIGGGIDMSFSGLGFFTTEADQVASLRASVARLEAAGVGYVVTARSADPFAAMPLPGMALAFDDGNSRVYEVPHAPYAELQGGPCSLHVITSLRQTATCQAPAHLLRRELPAAGWHARINGDKAVINEEQGMFQSIALPAGHDDIVWEYRPSHEQTMILLSIMGAAAIIGAAFYARMHRFLDPRIG